MSLSSDTTELVRDLARQEIRRILTGVADDLDRLARLAATDPQNAVIGIGAVSGALRTRCRPSGA